MATFIPPTDPFVSFADVNERGIFAALKPFPRGRNVYLLTDGSFTENQPEASRIAKIYHGGHVHTITADEQSALTAAGYGDYITA